MSNWKNLEKKFNKLKARLPEKITIEKRFFELKGKFFVEYPSGLVVELIPKPIEKKEKSYKELQADKIWKSKYYKS
jgi:hypothetical protein